MKKATVKATWNDSRGPVRIEIERNSKARWYYPVSADSQMRLLRALRGCPSTGFLYGYTIRTWQED